MSESSVDACVIGEGELITVELENCGTVVKQRRRVFKEYVRDPQTNES